MSGRLGWLGAVLARQIASIYGQAGDYAAYFTAGGQSNEPSALATKRQALTKLVQHIEQVLPKLAAIRTDRRAPQRRTRWRARAILSLRHRPSPFVAAARGGYLARVCPQHSTAPLCARTFVGCHPPLHRRAQGGGNKTPATAAERRASWWITPPLSKKKWRACPLATSRPAAREAGTKIRTEIAPPAALIKMVRPRRLELPRGFPHQHLKLARLPVPPRPHPEFGEGVRL